MDLSTLQAFHLRADTAEREIEDLKKQIECMKEMIKSPNQSLTIEFNQLLQEKAKLKHQITILKRYVESLREGERNSCIKLNTNEMEYAPTSLYNQLEKALLDAINKTYPDLADPPVVITLCSSLKFGDYQCNSAMPLSKMLASQGIKLSPRDIANKIIANVDKSSIIEKLEIAGPGFINIFLKRQFVLNALMSLLRAGKVLPPIVKKQKIIVDFSAPNIAKEMHVGHLRSTIIGDSISRLLEYLGHDVLRLNHVGDWGTQFGMLIAHLQDKFPDYLVTSPPISDLQAFYKESKKRFDEDAEFKRRAYNCVIKLQSFDADITKAWEMICNVSRIEFEKLYKRLDIKLLERGESFYQKLMVKLIEDFNKKKLLDDDNGRKIMWGEKEGVGLPLTMIKSDGGFTYDTSDMATIYHRINVEKCDWIIYVTDAGQATHFQSIESCAKRAGILTDQHKMTHVPFGVVLGEDKKKFKTRSGDTIKLLDLLDEGLNRALNKLKEKGRDKELTEDELKAAQEAVAYGCIKYSDLSQNRNHEYIFSFDKMLEDKGNTAVYLLYALTRIRSIARTANLTPEQIKAAIETTSVSLEHEKEWKLAKILLKFPDVLLKIVKDLYLHSLCEYCYEISCAFSEFYDNCYCIEKNKSGEIIKVNMGRILLAEATAMIFEQCFELLGIKTVKRM